MIASSPAFTSAPNGTRSAASSADEAAIVDRQLDVRVGSDVAVTGKMFADRGHAAGAQPRMQRAAEMRDGIGIAVECAIADDGARAMVEIEHRREAEVDAVGAQLRGDGPAEARRLPGRRRDVAVPLLAQRAHRGDRRESLPEPLHAPPFVVDGDQQVRRAHGANRGGKRSELRRRFEIAREQDHAAGERMREPFALAGVELDTRDVEEYRAARKRHVRRIAASRSSAFICRTASRKPTNTERATIAWPMCSSRTPGSAATGWTLK